MEQQQYHHHHQQQPYRQTAADMMLNAIGDVSLMMTPSDSSPPHHKNSSSSKRRIVQRQSMPEKALPHTQGTKRISEGAIRQQQQRPPPPQHFESDGSMDKMVLSPPAQVHNWDRERRKSVRAGQIAMKLALREVASNNEETV
eukprot:m.98330 g.98330  ORF g.98330 m.98330 type:complete len:143 (+) comp9007_c0_seq1:335-763(+)